MKKSMFKRIVSIMLAAVLALSLCACGDADDPANGTNGGNGKENAANSAAKQNVYSYEEIDIGIDANNANIQNMSYMNDKIYVLLQDYSGNYAASTMPLTSTEEATEESAVADGEAVVDNAVMEEFAYTGPVIVLITANLDGSDKKEVVLQREEDASGNGYFVNLTVAPNGNVYAMQEEYFEDYSDPENPIWEQRMYLMQWDTEGNLLWKVSLKEQLEDVEYFYPQGFIALDDGSVAFFSYEGLLFNYDSNGQMINKKQMDEASTANMGQIIKKADGTVYMTSYNDDWTKRYVCELDVATGTTGEKIELPGTITNYSFMGGTSSDFIMTNSLGVYTYNIGEEAPVMIMDFINSDFPSTNMNNVVVLDETHLLGQYYDYTDYTLHFAYCTKLNPEDIPDKTVLVFGCEYIDSAVRTRIVNFNKTNPEYRITIKDYSVYNTTDDYMAGNTQLNNDIISGQMPDILMLDSSASYNSYINKGLFADIGELIANDEELSQVEFLDNVFEAFSVNGKLYTVIPSFSVQTLVAKESVLGDKDGWNMSEFMEFANSLPEDVKLFGNDMLQTSFLYQLFSYAGTDFVNLEEGKCNFDSEEFIAALEYIKTLPAEYPEDYWENYDYSFYEGMYREDRAILMQLYMNDITYLVNSFKGEFGEDVTFIGFPTADGNGSVIEGAYRQFALSAKSKNIDVAWDFVRYYLTDEYQSSEELYEFPVLKSAFVARAQEATQKPYWIDDNGEKVEYDYTYYMNNESIILEPFTQEEVDEICEFIYSVNKRSYYNNDIRNIIDEEAASFFSGQKSAEEAAKIIQSRAQLYIDVNN